MARRREQAPAQRADELAVPADLLPIEAKARRLAYLAGQPYPMDELDKRAAGLREWFRVNGVSGWAARTAAVRAGREIASDQVIPQASKSPRRRN